MSEKKNYKEKDINIELLKTLSTAKFELIKKNVSGVCPTFEYELEFVQRICFIEKYDMSEEARAFFLKEYSIPFLTSIAYNIFHCTWNEIYGEYYEFISKDNPDTKVPFYKLLLFRAKNESSLRSYTATITSRHFTALRKKHNKSIFISIDQDASCIKDFSGSEMIDNPWFSLLLEKNEIENLMDYKLKTALLKLPYREQLIIKLMIMDNASGLEAFEDLKPYLRSKIPFTDWSDKQKQDAMALLKGRALKHLKQLLVI